MLNSQLNKRHNWDDLIDICFSRNENARHLCKKFNDSFNSRNIFWNITVFKKNVIIALSTYRTNCTPYSIKFEKIQIKDNRNFQILMISDQKMKSNWQHFRISKWHAHVRARKIYSHSFATGLCEWEQHFPNIFLALTCACYFLIRRFVNVFSPKEILGWNTTRIASAWLKKKTVLPVPILSFASFHRNDLSFSMYFWLFIQVNTWKPIGIVDTCILSTIKSVFDR